MLNEDVKIKNILGKTGSGKSLLCTEFWTLPALIDGEEVYTCLWINWKLPNWHFFKPRDFNAIKNLRNCVIIFDEYRQSFDPRNYAGESEEVRAFFELHRHRHNDIRGNTQDVSLVAKTIGIQAHEWSQVERLDNTWFENLLDWIRNETNIRIRQDYLTFQELKKMANGWELGEDVAINADWEIHKFDTNYLIHHELDDFKQELIHSYCPKCKMRQGFKTGKKIKVKRVNEEIGKLEEIEIDEIKNQIKSEETEQYCIKIIDNYAKNLYHYEWIEDHFCCKENHADIPLEIRFSGMFDTDYEPETVEEEFKIKKYVQCKACGLDHPIR